ncbi:GPH family glycoside/pentoside/hexuronide:cation symporter [Constrictibacter sp. MBR-5]|jgi:Na+/melibiose symporter-like transporter|uniref:MFS transporter n=1 Tax=Constrictibacter sp. MBR-5 TaxID=3156467 RepID=UPI0033986CD2
MAATGRPGERPVERLPAGLLAAYGIPGLPLAALLLPLYIYLPKAYADELGLGFATVGLVLFAARIVDLVQDPLVGWLSDRLPANRRRRLPMLVGTPPLLVAIFFLFLPPADAGAGYLLGWTLAVYLCAALVLLPWYAWGAEISADYDERSRIAGWREACLLLGTVTAASIAVVTGDGLGALEVLGWALLVALPATVVFAAWRIPEAGQTPSPVALLAVGWRRGARALFGNRPFVRLLAAYLLNGIANGLPATLFLLYVEHVLQAPGWSGPLLLVYVVCGVAAIPAWLALSSRIGKHRAWIASMLAACLLFAPVPWLGAGDTGWFLLVCIGTGICLGADLALPGSMQADVTDLDAVRSRRARAGLLFAVWGMATKLALAGAVGIAFPLLALAGFEGAGSGAGTGETPSGALFVLSALYALLPIGFKLAAAFVAWGYPIDAARQSRIRRILDRPEARRGAAA